MGTSNLITTYLASGGAIKRIPAGERVGPTANEWKRLVRGEIEPGVVATVEQHSEPRARPMLSIRVGHGARS